MSQVFNIKHHSKKDLAYQTLKDAVIDLRWRPGERKSLGELSSLLKVSRSPIAEACKLLEKEGWVIIKPQVGIEVAQLSGEVIAENYKIRGTLEGLAGMLALPYLKEIDFLALQEHVEDMEKAQKNEDLSFFIGRNEAFHRLICEASKSIQLINILTQIWESSKRYRVFFRHLPNVLKDSNNYHAKILSALKDRDVTSLRSNIERDSWDFGEKLSKYLYQGKGQRILT
jgi:DNA-binding GntR family transcriptional regulator